MALAEPVYVLPLDDEPNVEEYMTSVIKRIEEEMKEDILVLGLDPRYIDHGKSPYNLSESDITEED